MSKYRYYIADMQNLKILGTNDETVADSWIKDEDSMVFDAELGVWLYDKEPIEEATLLVRYSIWQLVAVKPELTGDKRWLITKNSTSPRRG
jgi:hypothetical protein